MKLAVAGKGGAGKTTFCATAARLVARTGRRVIAIDGDTNPNLHAAMGAGVGTDGAAITKPVSLPVSLVSRRFDGPALTVGIDAVLDHGCENAVELGRAADIEPSQPHFE